MRRNGGIGSGSSGSMVLYHVQPHCAFAQGSADCTHKPAPDIDLTLTLTQV